ncbi:hypothetical protein GCM10023201_40850 [Actinomycetospora corticicola]|uniref:Uncharacterized protein n=1 Tax=Actinomycetospora corticicola TaxID=663602 RepID=A0A7Y9J698_9PSEU|nr:hypothetical protein [Actinomycetospora corticicola]NYD36831.1 hypothetical protein [Actinomycetospora corticicola]
MTTPAADEPMVDPPLDVEVARDLPPEIDPIDVVTKARARMWTRGGVTNIGPLAQDLPPLLQQMLGDRADVIALSGLLWGAVSQLFNRLGPLQQVADEMPTIVKHSDEVHTGLQRGQDAIQTAVAAVQRAADAMTLSLGTIAQTAAQALAASAIASSKATALDARLAALEAREVRLYRAVGDLPTLAVGATMTRLCPWQGDAPSPLPTIRQCTVVQIAGTAATLTPTAVSAAGVTVTVRSANALLTAPNALQVVAATW